MKFKIGDKVIGNRKANFYGITCEGWKGVVKSVDNKGKTISARGRGFGGCTCTFTDLDASCFDLYVENVREIVITTDGKKTTARLYNDKKCVKTATAKCSPDDEFDFEVGARIAFDRLIKKEERDFDFYIRLRNDGGFSHARKGDVLKAHEIGKYGRVFVYEKDFPRKSGVDYDYYSWNFTNNEYDRISDEEAEGKTEKKDEFVPHLECDGKHYGNIGEPTNYKDAIGRPLFVGDVVEHFSGFGSYGYTPIVKSNVWNNEKAFVMGIECCCNDENGTLDGWKIIKKRSYTDVKHGEDVCGVKFVKEP